MPLHSSNPLVNSLTNPKPERTAPVATQRILLARSPDVSKLHSVSRTRYYAPRSWSITLQYVANSAKGERMLPTTNAHLL